MMPPIVYTPPAAPGERGTLTIGGEVVTDYAAAEEWRHQLGNVLLRAAEDAHRARQHADVHAAYERIKAEHPGAQIGHISGLPAVLWVGVHLGDDVRRYSYPKRESNWRYARDIYTLTPDAPMWIRVHRGRIAHHWSGGAKYACGASLPWDGDFRTEGTASRCPACVDAVGAP